MTGSILISENIYLIFLMIMAAVPVGFFAGFFGIGGGLISVPFLFFLFDKLNFDQEYLMHLSVGTSFSITILTSLASVLTHKKHKAVDINILKSYGIYVIVGVLFGTFVASLMNTKSMLMFFAFVVFVLGAYLLILDENKKKQKFNFTLGPKVILGFISGFISAPMGITGAMMNVPILRFFGYNISKAIGSAAAIGFIIAVSGCLGFFFSGIFLSVDLPYSFGFINIPAFLIFVPVTTFMAKIGATTVHNMNKQKAQKLFGVFLYVIGTLFLYRFLNF